MHNFKCLKWRSIKENLNATLVFSSSIMCCNVTLTAISTQNIIHYPKCECNVRCRTGFFCIFVDQKTSSWLRCVSVIQLRIVSFFLPLNNLVDIMCAAQYLRISCNSICKCLVCVCVRVLVCRMHENLRDCSDATKSLIISQMHRTAALC